ncbi:MAG: hypothetical protein U0359_29455 [Byssovorax sp.]
MSPLLLVPALLTPGVAVLGLVLRAHATYPAGPLPGSIFSAKEQAILAAAANAFFPPGGPIPISGTEAGVVAYMDRYVRRMAPAKRMLIRLLLRFVEHGPWIFGPRPVRFSLLRPAEQIRVLKAMSASALYFRRLSFLSLRMLLTMAYLANEEVARRIGALPCAAPFDAADRAPLGAQEAFA